MSNVVPSILGKTIEGARSPVFNLGMMIAQKNGFNIIAISSLNCDDIFIMRKIDDIAWQMWEALSHIIGE